MVSLQTIYEYNLRGSIVALQKEVVDDVVFYGDGKEKTYSGVYTYLRTGNRYLVMLSFLGTTITQAVSVKFGIGVENVIASIKDKKSLKKEDIEPYLYNKLSAVLVYWGVYPFWLGCKFLEEYGEEKVSKVYNGVEIIRGYDGDVRLWEKVIGQKPVFTKSLCVLLYYVYRRLGVLL